MQNKNNKSWIKFNSKKKQMKIIILNNYLSLPKLIMKKKFLEVRVSLITIIKIRIYNKIILMKVILQSNNKIMKI